MDILFIIKSVLNKNIRITFTHWDLITTIKHPEIMGLENEVMNCLINPIEIRQSSEDYNVYLYYVSYSKYFLCTVVKHLNGDGYIITIYLTDKIKEGELVWKK